MNLSTAIMASVTLPWPSADLSPNARVHWSKRAKAAKKAREAAYYACLAEGISNLGWEGVSVHVTFHPPARYRYDEDGLKSRCKPIFDGIADAIKIDDYHFTYPKPTIGEPIKHGSVVIRLSPAKSRSAA